MEVIGLPAIPGFASGNWRLERSQDVAVNPFGRTRHRTEYDGYVWRCALGCPKYNDEDAAVMEAWLDQVSEADHQLYVSPPQNELRGAWPTPELVSNGTFAGGVTTGWTGTGATLSVNARRLKVKNSGAAIGYARQQLAVTADVPYVLLVDLYAGSTRNWRIRLLDGADAEEHVSYYDKAGRVPIVHIPGSGTLKLELGCNTAVAGDDVKFGGVRMARCLLVDDSLAVGNELKVKGGPPSTDGAIKAGQFVTVRLWNGSQMMRLIEDFDTDANGKGTLKFGTALRAGVLGGGPVIVHAPFMRATLDAPVSESQLEAPNFKGLSLDALEDPGALDGEVPHDTDIILHWDANSGGLDPTIGKGTPTVTSDADDNYYTDSDGVLKKAAANSAVFEFNPITKALKGQRIQGARTNLLWPSDDFAGADWTKGESGTGITPVVTDNNAIAPDGTLTADKIVLDRGSGDASSDYSVLGRQIAGAVSMGSTYAGTIFLKGNKGETVAIRHVAGTDYVLHTFTGEWDRAFRVEVAGGTGLTFEVATRGTFGTTRHLEFWAWRGQIELGANATSPIKTTTASVARSADVDTLAMNLIPGASATEGTEVIELLNEYNPTGNVRYLELNNGTADERIVLYRNAAGSVIGQVDDGGANQASLALGAYVVGLAMRAALGWKANSFIGSLAGAAVVTDASGTIPTVTTVRKGNDSASQNQPDGYLRRITRFKAQKPARQIRSLSA